jgi:hypothetical protein
VRDAVADAEPGIELVIDAQFVRAAALDVIRKPVDVDANVGRLRRERKRGRRGEPCPR